MKSKTKADAEAKGQKVTKIKDFAELMMLVDEPILCHFQLDDKVIEIPVGRMSATTTEKVRSLRRAPRPPYRADIKDFDITDPKYREATDQAEKKARSLIIYSHCPMISKQKSGLTDIEQIHLFVNGLLSEHVLEIISLTIQAGGVQRVEKVEEIANFI